MPAPGRDRVSDGVTTQVVIHDRKYPNSLADVAADGNLIVLHSFSKVYGLAGLRVGRPISRPDIHRRLGGPAQDLYLGLLEMERAIAAIRDQPHVSSRSRWRRGKRGSTRLRPVEGSLCWPSEGTSSFPHQITADDLAARLRPRHSRGFLARFGLTTHPSASERRKRTQALYPR